MTPIELRPERERRLRARAAERLAEMAEILDELAVARGSPDGSVQIGPIEVRRDLEITARVRRTP